MSNIKIIRTIEVDTHDTSVCAHFTNGHDADAFWRGAWSLIRSGVWFSARLRDFETGRTLKYFECGMGSGPE